MPGEDSVQFGLVVRLFRIIGSSDPERKADIAETRPSSWWPTSTWSWAIKRCPPRSRLYLPDPVPASPPGRYSFAWVNWRKRLSLAAPPTTSAKPSSTAEPPAGLHPRVRRIVVRRKRRLPAGARIHAGRRAGSGSLLRTGSGGHDHLCLDWHCLRTRSILNALFGPARKSMT